MSGGKNAAALLIASSLFWSVAACAAEYTLDFTCGVAHDAEAPVLRRAEMPANVGTVPAVAVGDTLNLRLFGDVDYALRIVSAPPAGIAGQSFIAKDANGSASAIVKVSEKTARISVDDFMNRRQYTVRCKDGKVLIVERDNSQMDDGECGTCGGDIEVPQPAVEETKTTSTKKSRTLLGASGNEFPLAEQKSVVDILVAFDKGAKNWLNNGNCEEADTIEEFADYAVNKMNTVLQNSQLNDQFCYRLVGVTEIDDSWMKIDSDLLGKVRTRDGKLARLGQLRDKCGADTITLLVNRTSGNTAGIGYGLSNVAANYVAGFNNANYGVNVCDIKAVYERYTMSHETGHNMGCGHSDKQGNGSSGSSAGPQSEPYSCGYHFYDANNVRRYTVMAYSYTSGQSPDYTDYKPVPYFSTPDITPAEYGVPVGTEEKNNNRKVLTLTHESVSNWREHVLPYDWDVRFLDDNGNDIPDGTLFYGSTYVTLSNANANASIYYTLDGSTPTTESLQGGSGTKVYMYLTGGSKTLTACAVVEGKAQSVCSITLRDGLTWSGDSSGNGLWLSGDSSVRTWSGEYFYNGDAVRFDDLSGISSATVTVMGAVAPSSVSFSAVNTAYTFDKGDDDANISIPDASFAPAGDVTFNLRVQMSATTFTSMTGFALTFNAPFGQTVDAANGNCTNMISISHGSTLTAAPGMGNTQTFGRFDTSAPSTATFRAGAGNIVFNGPYDGGNGVFGDAQVIIGEGANVTFNCAAATGFNKTSPFTIEKGATVSFNGNMEHMRRPLYLNGGTINASARFDRMYAAGITVNDDSVIAGNGNMLIRYADEQINVVDGKSLTLNIPTQDGSNTEGWGIIKRGRGTIVANAELKHSGVTDIEEGAIEVGYSSGSTAYGQGWIVASNSTLRVKSGCALKVPSLTLDPTSIISLPAATSAPLVVNGNVDLTGVRISIQTGGDLSLGASYPLISATGNISGIKSLVRESWPKLGTGLGWKIAVSGGVLTASIVNAAESDPYVDFITNVSGLRLALPSDAAMAEDSGLRLASSPIEFDNLDETAVSITLDVTLGEPTTEERTICSWKIGSYIVRCVVTNGVIDCFWADNSHVANSVQSIKLLPGRHAINIGYKSLSDDTYGGTFVYADGRLAYRAAGLRWSNDKVSRVTIGASAAETPAYKYDGLVVNSLALLTSSANEPLPNMTSSGGAVEYSYFAGKPPCVFALTPDGGFETYGAVLSAGIASPYEALSVSVVASFPENATGTIFSSVVRASDSYVSYATQVEYRGDGVLAFRDDGGDSLATTCKVSADMASPHLYTMTYKMGVGFKLFMDSEEVMSNSAYFQDKSLLVWARVVFGCGYWTDWMTSYDDNPNPISNLKVYASHIALGTDDPAVSETAVKEAAGYEPEEPEPEPPETPAVVDVLVAYDLGAQAYVAGKSLSLEDFAATQIQKMNDVLVTNKLERFYTYRLAGVCKVNDTYDNIDTAPAQAAGGNGAMVSLRAAREMYGADTVTLLVDVSGNTLGNSSQLNSPDNVASQHECAFSVCSIRAVDTGKQHTMIHENAHNMGCGHARTQSIINSPFEYGRGYYFKDGNVTRHTIMAYGGDDDASWYFSTTSDEFGFTLGDKTNNNARVLKETCGEVAKWREGAAIDFSGVELDGVTWQTSLKYPWAVEGDTVRSYNQTNYTYQCTTPLKATIEGPKVLSFKYKSYFGGTTIAGNNYSHFDVLLDDSPVLTQTECTNSWSAAQIDIPAGTHEVTFVFSQRFAMNDSEDYKDGTPEADDAVWLKDIVLANIECAHSSTSDEVSSSFPQDATKVPDSHVDGLVLDETGITQTLDFGSTNAVVASVLAELPDGVRGEIAGCHVYRASKSEHFYAFAYSNGDGTFSLGYDTTTNKVTSYVVADWTAPHVWTFAFAAQTGAKLYCDGVEIASSSDIKWNNTSLTGTVTFGDDPRGGWPLSGAKIYAVRTDFGVGDAIFTAAKDATNNPLADLDFLADYSYLSYDMQLELFCLYRTSGLIEPGVTHECALRISEIMPKPTDAQNRGALEGMDVNGLESGWVEVENTSDKWVDLADYRFIRVNRGKKTDPAGFGNFPSRLVPPRSRAIFYTSERYSNSKSQKDSAFENGKFKGKPEIFKDYGNILVWGDKVNPKKSPFVRLYYMPNAATTNVVDTVVIPSDLPEGWSIIVGDAAEGEGTRRWMCPTPTRGAANTATDGLTRIGPNVGPLYEKKGQKKTDLASEFAEPVPPAVPGTDYTVTLPINAVMNPDGTFTPRTADLIQSVKFVYRKDLDDATLVTNDIDMAAKTTDANWGDQYTATIPASYFPAAGHLMQWKVLITDGEGVEWTSPSFNNPDDGYEWYGTIVEPDAATQMSATLPTWHMFADSASKAQMDYDKDDSRYSLANGARVAIYDSSTSNYYDYVRIDLRGNTSAGFTKKGHGLRFAKAHPLTMVDSVTGETIEEIRKTSLISEFADPSFMRQMVAFWLWKKMGNLVPFDFPVRCNLNGEFYQLAFNSERFTDELIEDVYGLDKFGYGYKNVGTLKSGSGTTAGGIEKKTPDDENESDITVLQNELRSKITAAQQVSSSPDGGSDGLDNSALTKFVVQKFNLPAWLNYLASARITQEMDDVWANVCIYYDNPDMKEGSRGTGTWMPLGYDFNLTFGQHYRDGGMGASGLKAQDDWFKCHPLYGGNRVRCYSSSAMTSTINNGNDGFESVLQSAKFRRLYLRRLRTLMDQQLKEPGTAESGTPFMAKMREMADLMRTDATQDTEKWGNDGTDNNIDVWPSNGRPANMDAGIDDIWDNYVVPRREHLYVTHSVTNTAKEVGYGSNLNAGIPKAQSPVEALALNISISNLTALDAAEAEALGVSGQLYDTEVVVIRNDNDEVVDMSGWRLAFSVDFTFPAGTVCDANDSIYIVADRRAYIDAHDAELTDRVIVGNATFTGAGPIALYDAEGTLVYSAIPQTSELKYLRLHSFYGNTLDGGDTGEWFTLTNISDTATLDLADVTVCFLKQGDPHDTTDHCHVTLENKKGKGSIAPLKSWTASQADYFDKGWEKIQNNKQQITIYDKYGSVCQSLKVTQKNFTLAYGKGGYLVCDSADASVTEDSQWHEALPNNGESSEPFAADSQEAADELVANAKPALTQEDAAAGLEPQYLKVVAEPVEGSLGKYKAVVVVNPDTVKVPVMAQIEEGESTVDPLTVESDEEGSKVTGGVSNARGGLWYGFIWTDSIGVNPFENDVESFKCATSTSVKIESKAEAAKSAQKAFFRVKVLPAKPK